MQTTLQLNLNNLKDRQALRAMLDVLDDAPPEGLDISSGATESFDPARVSVWTSTEGAEMVKDVVNLAPNVDQVVTKSVDEPEAVDIPKTEVDGSLAIGKEAIKEKKADKKRGGRDNTCSQAPQNNPKPDAKAIVEAVVGVKTGKGTEVEGTAEEVAETLDGEKIDDETVKALKKLQVKLAKYTALDEMKATIREITGIQKGKLSDIPAKHGPALTEALTAVVSRLESEGK